MQEPITAKPRDLAAEALRVGAGEDKLSGAVPRELGHCHRRQLIKLGRVFYDQVYRLSLGALTEQIGERRQHQDGMRQVSRVKVAQKDIEGAVR
ncbi:hypothetical protein GCM10023346_23820 [Arthrobacter gyeryongensis]|uniref:Uncharacterized protein n=1 Tax=Arthrobacter gyeryongensis TaxID=1650592 RepID=A0ABP9SES0_9MICC